MCPIVMSVHTSGDWQSCLERSLKLQATSTGDSHLPPLIKSPPHALLAALLTVLLSHGHCTTATAPIGVSGHCSWKLSLDWETERTVVTSSEQASKKKLKCVVSYHVQKDESFLTSNHASWRWTNPGNIIHTLTKPLYAYHTDVDSQILCNTSEGLPHLLYHHITVHLSISKNSDK